MIDNPDVLVIGAGIAGLMAARRLTLAGLHVMVVEKNVTAGGRLSTVRLDPGLADSGAQFFTVRTREFQQEVDNWLEAELVYEWSRGWSDGSLLTTPVDGYSRYAARGGFSSLAFELAQEVDVQYSTRLVSLSRVDKWWQVRAVSGAEWHCRAAILTSPVPQSLELLENGRIRLPDSDLLALQSIQYAPCLSGLFRVEGQVNLPRRGALQRPGEAISWIADNQQKGISPDARVLTVHANRQASEWHWSLSDASILSWMSGEIAPWLEAGTRISGLRLDRWRYAVPIEVYPARCFVADIDGLLVFAGDAFDGPRLEGAVLSGWAAAEVTIHRIPPA